MLAQHPIGIGNMRADLRNPMRMSVVVLHLLHLHRASSRHGQDPLYLFEAEKLRRLSHAIRIEFHLLPEATSSLENPFCTIGTNSSLKSTGRLQLPLATVGDECQKMA